MMGGKARAGKRARPSGFTIIETMLVLAVSAALFVAIAVGISGRQNRVRFQQAINEATLQIQRAVNEVQTGYYPTSEGTSSTRMWIGKVIQLRGTANAETYTVHSLTGARSATELSSTTLAPQVITAASQTHTFQYGLSTAWVRTGSTATTGNAVDGIGIAAYFTQTSGVLYGSQSVRVLAVNGTSTNAIQNNFAGSAETPVYVCLASGGSNQSGLITIGGGDASVSNKNSVTVEIKSNRDCS